MNCTTPRGSHSVLLLTVTRSILVAGVVPRHNSATWWRTLTLPLQSHHEPFSSRSFASSCFVFLSSLMWRHNTWRKAMRRVTLAPTTRSNDFQCALHSLSYVWIGLVIAWMDGWNFILFFFKPHVVVCPKPSGTRHCSLNLS